MAASDEDLFQRQRETVAEHIRAENAHDWPGVYDTFVEDENAHYDVVPLSTHFSGMQGVKESYAVIDAVFPDFQVTVNREYDMPGSSIREVTVTGTHKADYCGVPASGNHVSIEIAAFYLFSKEDPGKLVAERVYLEELRLRAGQAGSPTRRLPRRASAPPPTTRPDASTCSPRGNRGRRGRRDMRTSDPRDVGTQVTTEADSSTGALHITAESLNGISVQLEGIGTVNAMPDELT